MSKLISRIVRQQALSCGALITSILALGSCGTPPPPPAVVIGAGWNCLSYPTAFRPPGVVYQIDKDTGSATTFEDLSNSPGFKISSSDFVDVSASQSNKANASVIASLLGLPLKASANANSVFTVSQTFGNAIQTDMDQQTAYALEDAFFASPLLAEAMKRGDAQKNNYLLVQNTIQATAVTYSFDRDISADIDVGVTPVKIGSVELKANLDNDTGTKYSKTFKAPQVVCIQAAKLNVQLPKKAGLIPFSAERAVWSTGPGDAPLFK